MCGAGVGGGDVGGFTGAPTSGVPASGSAELGYAGDIGALGQGNFGATNGPVSGEAELSSESDYNAPPNSVSVGLPDTSLSLANLFGPPQSLGSILGMPPSEQQSVANTIGKALTNAAVPLSGPVGLAFGKGLSAAINSAEQGGQIGSNVSDAAALGEGAGGLGGPGDIFPFNSAANEIGEQDGQQVPSIANMPSPRPPSSQTISPGPNQTISPVELPFGGKGYLTPDRFFNILQAMGVGQNQNAMPASDVMAKRGIRGKGRKGVA